MSHSVHKFKPNPNCHHCYGINRSYYSTFFFFSYGDPEHKLRSPNTRQEILSSPSFLTEYILVPPFYPCKQHAFLTQFVLVTASFYDDSPLLKYECWPQDALLRASSPFAYASGRPRIMTQTQGRGQRVFCWQNRKTASELGASVFFFFADLI